MTKDDARINDPHYLWGHIQATRALVVAIANVAMSREEFASEAHAAIERLRTASLPMTVGDNFLSALDDTDAWVSRLTE